MNQITDEQFIESMKSAVCKKGEGHSAPGAYWGYDADTGQSGAYCIIGFALFQISKDLCPKDNMNMAHPLLKSLGCSDRVAYAAHAAQYANDLHWGWGEVLEVFNWSLSHYHPGIEVSDLVHRAIDEAHRRRSLRQAQAPKQTMPIIEKPQYVEGGIVSTFSWTGVSASTETIVAYQNIVKAFASVSMTATYAEPTPVLVKKDHALTA